MKFQKKFVNLFIISLLLLLAIVACSPSGSGGDIEPDVESGIVLDSTSWVLNELGPEDAVTAVLPADKFSTMRLLNSFLSDWLSWFRWVASDR